MAPDESIMMVSERIDSTHVRQTSPGYPRRELDKVDAEPVVDIFDEIHDVPDAAVSPNRRSYSETDGSGAVLYYEEDISDSKWIRCFSTGYGRSAADGGVQ